ncbi:MAG: hypothetical protein R6X12_01480 [bacterium]
MLLMVLLCAFPVYHVPSGRVEYCHAPEVRVLADTMRDWGDDVLVGAVGRALTTGKLVTDSDTAGTIYVGLLEPGGGPGDRVHVWRSTDGGWSWTTAYEIAPDDPFASFADYELRVGSDANGTWLYDLLVGNPPGIGLWLLRHRPMMVSPAWIHVPGSDTVVRVAADLNIESPQRLFAAWETQAGEIHLAASSDSGQTWGNHRVAATGCELPALAAGGDGCVYLACNSRDSAWVQVTRYTENLAGADSAVARLDSAGNGRVWAASVAADREAGRTAQAAVVLYCSSVADSIVGVGQGWTTNGGAGWTTGFWPPVNQTRVTWDARLPRVRRGYADDLFRGAATMPEPTRNRDSLVYAYSRPVGPNVWEGRGVRNDFRMVLGIGAQVGYSWLTSGGYLGYAKLDTDQVWFDGYHFTAIEEQRPSRPGSGQAAVVSRGGVAILRFGLAASADVSITLFDAGGRAGGRLYRGRLGPGQHVVSVALGDRPPGVYYCLVDSGERVERVKVVRPE